MAARARASARELRVDASDRAARTRVARTQSTTKLADEHLRALRFLAGYPSGCTEAMLLKQGFTTEQPSQLVFVGLAKLRGAGRSKMFRAGQRAIAE